MRVLKRKRERVMSNEQEILIKENRVLLGIVRDRGFKIEELSRQINDLEVLNKEVWEELEQNNIEIALIVNEREKQNV